MPGLYSIPTRGPGTLITSLIYNGDHQAHVDSRNATIMQSFGVTSTQFLTEASPFAASGSESLPLSLGDELARLRFVIAALKSAIQGDNSTFTDASPPTTPWTQPVLYPGFAPIGARVQRSTTLSIPFDTPTTLDFTGGVAEFNTGVWEGIIHPTRFTAPNTGKYYVSAGVAWQAFTGYRDIVVYTNGVAVNAPTTSKALSLGLVLRMTIEAIVKLNATDFIEFKVHQISNGVGGGVAKNVTADSKQSIVGAMMFLGSNP
jgi:hypothetical protein